MVRIIGRIALALTVLLSLAVSPQAQDYPNRPVKIVVPYPPGGSNDVIARILAQRLSEDMKQQFIVENRAGANGNVGAASVATGDADGLGAAGLAWGAAGVAGEPLPLLLAFSLAGFGPPNDWRRRRATGASTVDDADLTNSP